jgi:hypothetical protein
MIDKVYAMSSFLQFREVYGNGIRFSETLDFPYKKHIKIGSSLFQVGNKSVG